MAHPSDGEIQNVDITRGVATAIIGHTIGATGIIGRSMVAMGTVGRYGGYYGGPAFYLSIPPVQIAIGGSYW